tara:strand:- start:23428 stop:24534 length:1107 start_codon:yes stop_codon:yes gene_type:complete
MQRIHSIDYFRGLMALAVLVYHYVSWSVGVPESETILGRLGIYAVSSFYVVSGISLYLVYRDSHWGWSGTVSFSIKRFLRLAPLYWIATVLTIFYYALNAGAFSPDWSKYLANFTLAFGLYSPQDYIPVGGWSIGNEVAFYVFFPFLILSLAKVSFFMLTMAVVFALYIYCSFFMLSSDATLAEQWGLYILPYNQAFLFASGVAVGWLKERFSSFGKTSALGLLIASVLVFVFYPVSGNQINIVTGLERLVFTACCVSASFALLYHPSVKLTWVARPLGFLGDTSYTIYMLHGVSGLFAIKYVAPWLGVDTPTEKLIFLLIGVLPFVLLVSSLIYRVIELRFIRLGKKITRKIDNQIGRKGPVSPGYF